MKKSQEETQPETRFEKLRRGFSLVSIGSKMQLGDKIVSRKTGKLVDCPMALVGVPIVQKGLVAYRPKKFLKNSKPN